MFISYRRDDSAAHAGRLRDEAVRRLGEDNVFLDVSAITPGEDFDTHITRALSRSDVQFVVIGPDWLARGPDGRSRLSETGDYVRLEVVRALDRDVPVVPVLVGGASLPAPDALPAALRPLLRRQAVRLHDETWHNDVDDLFDAFSAEAHAPDARSRRRRWPLVALGFTAILVALTILLVQLSSYPACADPAEPDAGWRSLLTAAPVAEATVTTNNGSVSYRAQAAHSRQIGDGLWDVVLDVVKSNVSVQGDVDHDAFNYPTLSVDRFPAEVSCFEAMESFVGVDQSGRARVGFEVTIDPAGKQLRLIVEEGEQRAGLAFTAAG